MIPRAGFRLSCVFAAAGLALIGGCTPAPKAPAPVATAPPETAQQASAAGLYGENLERMLRADPMLTQILITGHVTTTLRVGLLVAPNGVVEKGLMLKSSAQPNVEQAILGRLIAMNFGNFSAAMPGRPLIFLIPIIPPANAGPGQSVSQAAASFTAPAFQVKGVVLYQPNSMLVARLGHAAPLADYIQRIDVHLAPLFAAALPQPGVTLAVVVGVKPGLLSRSWVVAPDGSLPAPLIAQIQAAADAVAPVRAQNGPIAFAIMIDAWGGGAPITDAAHPVPMPQAWQNSAPTAPELVPDGIFARIWP
jgi:hypothetical protein